MRSNERKKRKKLLLIYFFFYLGFLLRTFTNHRTAGEGGGHFFNSSLHFHPLHRHLDISRAITAESSPVIVYSSIGIKSNFFRFFRSFDCILPLMQIPVKTCSMKFHALCIKTFGNSAKFSLMVASTCSWIKAREIVFFFLIISPKDNYKASKLYETLKSNISFNLKYSFMYLTNFIQVA